MNKAMIWTMPLVIVLAVPLNVNATEITGHSEVLSLIELVPDAESAERLNALGEAMEIMRITSAKSLTEVRRARQAYEENPGPETEAGLFNANAKVIQNQYVGLQGIEQASQAAVTEVQKLRKEAAENLAEFADNVKVDDQEKFKAEQTINEMGIQLQKLAGHFEEIVGPDGQITDPDLERAVLEMKQAYDHHKLIRDLLDNDARNSKQDLQGLKQLQLHLERLEAHLLGIARHAAGQRNVLAVVAQSQMKKIERRKHLMSAVNFITWAQSLNIEAFGDGTSVVIPSTGGLSLKELGLPEVPRQSGADVLRELLGTEHGKKNPAKQTETQNKPAKG